MSKRKPIERNFEIIQAALVVAAEPGGWSSMTREQIAERAGCATGSVSKHLGTMKQLRRSVMRSAVLTENLSIIAQGIAAGDQHALKASDELKRRALSTLVG